jgi:hypothetical protein
MATAASSWYVAYGRARSRIMSVFSTREGALCAACRFLQHGFNEIEVAPMLEAQERNTLKGDELRCVCRERMPDPSAENLALN